MIFCPSWTGCNREGRKPYTTGTLNNLNGRNKTMAFDFGAASAAWEAFKAVRDFRGGDKLTQQTAGGVMPTLEDEAILLAVDQAVSQLTADGPLKVDGKKVMKKIAALRSKRLKSHQRDRWRKIVATLILTEHFEKFETSVVTKMPASGTGVPKEGDQVNVPFGPGGRRQQQNNTKKTGLHEIIRSFQRVHKDYEYTYEDPRVGHLVMIAGLIASDDPQYDPDKDIDDFKMAYEYLLSNYFDEKSISETAIEKTKKLYEAIASGAYDVLISLGLENDFSTVEMNVAKDDPERIAKLNAGYETALDQAITRKWSEIESYRDGIQVWDGWKDKNGKDLVRIKRKWIPTYFSPGTWVFIITVAAIFLFAASNSKG